MTVATMQLEKATWWLHCAVCRLGDCIAVVPTQSKATGLSGLASITFFTPI
jgi:hypothetical protein